MHSPPAVLVAEPDVVIGPSPGFTLTILQVLSAVAADVSPALATPDVDDAVWAQTLADSRIEAAFPRTKRCMRVLPVFEGWA